MGGPELVARPVVQGSQYSYPHIRTELLVALEDYRLRHRPLGGFLRSVVKGDFSGVILHADISNQHFLVLRDYCWYFHNELGPEHKDYETWVQE